MPKADLVLLHAPSVYDFRDHSILYGPVSDLVPSSPIFEMYPIGFTSILEYLERAGFNVKIVNLALMMMRDLRFDVERAIAKMKPLLFGIDLHWLPHAHGAIEIARLCKKYHPDIPVVMGGYSASYFHEEIMEYGCVDYVIRGDSTEQLMLELMECIRDSRPVSGISNLTYREESRIKVNEMDFVPADLDDLVLDYTPVIKATRKFRNITGFLPFKDWMSYPITAVLTCRGCTCGCVNCGGSASGINRVVNRKKPAFRDPGRVASDIVSIANHFRGPIFVLGDITQRDMAYAEALLDGLKGSRIKNQVVFEFFKPWPAHMYERVAGAVPNFSIEGSIDSHDPAVRKAVGKHYTNEAITQSIGAALDAGCSRFDLYFMVGLPGQTKESAVESAYFCRDLYKRFDSDKRLMVFTSPLAPFLDPGSPAFENPERFGYRLFARTLEEHRTRLLEHSWKYILNYETQWMDRHEIVEATYAAGEAFNMVKNEFGIISDDVARRTAARIKRARHILAQIDSILEIDDRDVRDAAFAALKQEADTTSISTVCEKSELQWSIGLQNFNKMNLLKTLLSS